MSANSNQAKAKMFFASMTSFQLAVSFGVGVIALCAVYFVLFAPAPAPVAKEPAGCWYNNSRYSVGATLQVPTSYGSKIDTCGTSGNWY